MNPAKAAKKIAEIFEETDADEISELSVPPDVAEPLADALRQFGFTVTMERRFSDVERTKVARYALRVVKADKTRTNRT
ncbi:MAG TPA: hypothetical protein VKL19_00945 [Thermoanaerobaculia bacterium]|nr:hypothetical protein [Thermoanaerobaculia bacterium]